MGKTLRGISNLISMHTKKIGTTRKHLLPRREERPRRMLEE